MILLGSPLTRLNPTCMRGNFFEVPTNHQSPITAFQHDARSILSAKGRRQRLQFLLQLPVPAPEKRAAITALYAFCREVDDIADECRDVAVARAKLDWWRGEIEAAFRGNASHPVSLALARPIADYRLPLEHFLDVIVGMEMDLTAVRYATFDDLRLYCHRVASVVGLLSAAIFGYTQPATRKFAEDLGVAFQLTNIIRDVGEDARRDRIYLPQEDLRRFGMTTADILNGSESENFRNLMAFETERAFSYYNRAMQSLPDADRSRQLPSLIMAAIYQATLAAIRDNGFRVLDRKTILTPMRKLWIAWKTRRRELRRARGFARA